MVGGAKPSGAAAGGATAPLGVGGAWGVATDGAGADVKAGAGAAAGNLGIDSAGSATGVIGNAGTDVLVGADDAHSIAWSARCTAVATSSGTAESGAGIRSI